MDPEGIYTEDICSDKTLLHRMQVTCVMQGYGEPNGSMVREVLLQFSSVALCPGRCSVAAGWLRASPLCWANRVPVLLLVTGTRPFLGPLGTLRTTTPAAPRPHTDLGCPQSTTSVFISPSSAHFFPHSQPSSGLI